MSEIEKFYLKNNRELHKIYEDIVNTIDGRICHSSILCLLIIAELFPIKNYLEIGVHNGGSMGLLFSNNKIKKVYGIDLFEDIYDEKKHVNFVKFKKYSYFKKDNLSLKKTEKNLMKINEKYGNATDFSLIKGNSYFDETEENFKNQLYEKIDLLFIDGDHTFDGVKNDYERYSKYVRDEGIIVFDDYHHPEIKFFCDKIVLENNLTVLCKFQSINSKAISMVIKK